MLNRSCFICETVLSKLNMPLTLKLFCPFITKSFAEVLFSETQWFQVEYCQNQSTIFFSRVLNNSKKVLCVSIEHGILQFQMLRGNNGQHIEHYLIHFLPSIILYVIELFKRKKRKTLVVIFYPFSFAFDKCFSHFFTVMHSKIYSSLRIVLATDSSENFNYVLSFIKEMYYQILISIVTPLNIL